MKSKRSYEKRITREAQILRFFRHQKKLSLNQVGSLVGITGSAVAHIEQGRMDISRARLRTFLDAFSVSQDEFLELLGSDEQLISLRDECLALLKQMDESKLVAVHAVLANMSPQISPNLPPSKAQQTISRFHLTKNTNFGTVRRTR